MTIARKNIVIKGEGGIYHCVSRCVRRAFLCGFDVISGKSYDHRKEFIRARIQFLVKIFTIDVLTYALMSNHAHLLLKLYCPPLSNEEVAKRWLKLYPPKGKAATKLQIETLAANERRINLLRERLSSISWFMKSLNEYIARIANKEDGCKGRFWEGRFKCQRIEDEAGLLACSIYVDLNPIRSKMALTPEESTYTGAFERIQAAKKGTRTWLPAICIKNNGYLDMNENQYFELLDWTGRQLVAGKRGSIPLHLKGILQRMKINEDRWIDTSRYYGKWYRHIVGTSASLKQFIKKARKRWCLGVRAAKISFAT